MRIIPFFAFVLFLTYKNILSRVLLQLEELALRGLTGVRQVLYVN
jgi:hypothetical protein